MNFQKEKTNKYNKKRPSCIIIGFFIFLLLFISFSFKIEPIYAQMVVSDPILEAIAQAAAAKAAADAAAAQAAAAKAAAEWKAKAWYDKLWTKTKEIAVKTGSSILQDSITTTLNKLAYDAANRLATGNKGQGSLFIKENWNKYLFNMEDRAKGEFLEQLGRKNGFIDFNLCEPKLDVKLKIGLGMVEMNRPHEPACTWSKMKNNWKNEYERLKAMGQPDFLKIFQQSFEPAGNDLGAALTLQTGMTEKAEVTYNEEGLKLQAKGGWLDPTDIAGHLKSLPGWAKDAFHMTGNNLYSNIGKFTGNALVDASKIFLNQLAISAFNAKMMKLGEKVGPTSSPYNYEGGTSNQGIAGTNEFLRQLLEPSFDTRADYDILASLSSCNKIGEYAPTNGCVIEESFRQAIEERKTVGEAMALGYLKKDWPFGFRTMGESAIEPIYNQGYPYRSMLILRKYRIIPVGWELAAEYIHFHQEELKNASLAKMVACFDSGDSYIGYFSAWCRGLVDPNWVLKAPQNFCAKEGYGPEIVSDEIVDSGEGGKERTIVRNDNYCADEQSCIKERNDGSCEAYGYCTQERRSWNFNSQSCEPKYNTCQTFRATDGKTVSYLENTLDYSGCSANNVGCKGYATSFASYATSTDSVNWTSSNSIYFNKNVEECNQEDEGCHEFIRTKSNLGTNLIINSGFEESLAGAKTEGSAAGSYKLDNWPVWLFNDSPPHDPPQSTDQKMTAEIVYNADRGGNVLHIKVDNSKGGLYSYDYSSSYWSDQSVMPKGFIMESGTAYTLSAYVYLVEGESIKAAIGNNDTRWEQVTLTGEENKNVWKRIAITINNDSSLGANEFYIYGYNNSGGNVDFYVDNVQFEIGGAATAYKDYGGANVVYEKLAPAYLNCEKANPPARCSKFASTCQPADVGCELYTSVADKISIPAKTTISDYCPEECNGFDTYIQAETNFASSSAEYFIPKSAKTCSADAAGCDEFTNLDEVAKGGEGKEYYTYLRQCIKPGANCAEFYTWEGSDESGYQLKVFNLKSNGDQPATTSNDISECSETIYNLPATDPGYNPDCRQFYNKEGQISYHLYTRTISCSNNCHSYRRTAIDESQTNCTTHGGQWDGTQQACIYMAIPGEGKSCSATQAGCREYSGNKGSNMRIVLNNDFPGNTQGWTGSVASEALTVGGNSLKTSGNSTSKIVGVSVQKGRSYVLSFIAKKDGVTTRFNSIKLAGGGGEEGFIAAGSLPATLSSEWKLYKFNLAKLNHDVDDSESLVITADGNFFVDDIRLTEIVDRYYLIKDSWQTPDSCNQDINGNPFPLYMLGCDQYQDREGKTYYLHNFSRVCQESAVGCELMIDTHNYSEAGAYTSATDPVVTVAADNLTYVVYDATKQCNKADKGCGRFGSPYKYGEEIVYGDVYIKNNPDRYADILCGKESEGCQAWATEGGNSFFKDPGDMVCEWRQITGETGWSWYKKKVKRCGDNNGKICLKDQDCLVDSPTTCVKNEDCGSNNLCLNNRCYKTCQLETKDTPCLTSDLKTFGYGGEGQTVYQPEGGWAGTCPAAQAGCTEYIDPISKPISGISYEDKDQVSLEPFTLYILKGTGASSDSLSCPQQTLNKLAEDNSLETGVKLLEVSGGKRIIFFNASVGNNNCTIGGKVELKKAIIEYRLNQELDKKTCNGLVDFEQGCILFNERVQNGGNGLAGLNYNANATIDDKSGVPPQPKGAGEENNANALIKVTPNRVCDQWLACRSYIKDQKNNNVCFDVGLCNGFDDNGNCANFISSPGGEQIFKTGNSPDAIGNLTGYSKVGYENGDLDNNYYSLGGMEQVGDVISLSNGGFEMAGGNGYPVGWSNTSGGGTWDDSKFKVITNASEAKKELGGSSPPEGKNILKMSSGTSIASEELNFEAKTYIISAYVNTMNLSGGTVGINLPDGTKLEVDPGKNGYVTKKFPLGAAVKWKITVFSNATGGVAYFDDIKIKPALEIKSDRYSTQSCRLYPKEDSLSCDYMDNAGVKQKGLTGYCLEYDRYPGSADSCLLWYPVDKVRGEGIEEGAGYKGKFPLYYCTGLTTGIELKYKAVADDQFWLYIDGDSIAHGRKNGDYRAGVTNSGGEDISIPRDEVGDGVFAPGKHVIVLKAYNKPAGGGYVEALIEAANSAYMEPLVTSIEEKYGWSCAEIPNTVKIVTWFFGPQAIPSNTIHQITYAYDDGLKWEKPTYVNDSTRNPGVQGIWAGDSSIKDKTIVCRTVIDIAPVCKEFIQAVSAAGENKVYQARLSGGESGFIVNVNKDIPGYFTTASYNTDAPPFGTIVYPKPAANPYEWDTKNDEGIQPLYYSQDKDSSRMGQLYKDTGSVVDNYHEGELKKLFAQSYGRYRLSEGVCSLNNQACAVKQTCTGGGYCAPTGDTVYYCDSNSGNAGDECSSVASCAAADCRYNEEKEAYTCGGTPSGSLCCAPLSFCVNGKCSNSGATCDIAGTGTPDDCTATGKYKCDLETQVANPNAGTDCCYGSVCSNVCAEGVNAGKACVNPNPDCPIMKCSNNNLTCSSQQDPNCLKAKTCVGGERNIGANCEADSTICNGIDGTCSERRCDGGDNDNEVCNYSWDCPGGTCPAGTCSGGARSGNLCYGPSDCPSNDGVCTATYWPCGISTTYGACNTPQCVGGPNKGITCTLGGDNQGCTAKANDKCVSVYRINNGKRCCGLDTGNPTCKTDPGDPAYKLYACSGGQHPNQPCSSLEVGLCSQCSNNTSTRCSTNADCSGGECQIGTCEGTGRYIPDSGFINWTPSGGLNPSVSNIKVNGAIATTTTIIKNGFANLTFNTTVDVNQLPLVRYEVNWGDGGTTVVSGVEMNHRPYVDDPDLNKPHSVYHLYSYWDLKNKDVVGDGITCGTEGDTGYCTIKPTVTIKDNWGYPGSGVFGGTIKVTEK